MLDNEFFDTSSIDSSSHAYTDAFTCPSTLARNMATSKVC
jgi:hypothetical protein